MEIKRKINMEIIGGYIIVAHRLCSGYSDDSVTHAFKDLDAAKEYARARRQKIDETYYDIEGGHDESRPTIHAVAPKLFEKVQDHLLKKYDRDSFMFELGTAITKKRHPYSYGAGEIKVLCTKSEAPATEAPARSDRGFPPLISSPFVA
jgi:hypothetical protein